MENVKINLLLCMLASFDEAWRIYTSQDTAAIYRAWDFLELSVIWNDTESIHCISLVTPVPHIDVLQILTPPSHDMSLHVFKAVFCIWYFHLLGLRFLHLF